jgi:2-phospho-L-lactate guanylyltransferase (CobY/MobA/RfbA family)
MASDIIPEEETLQEAKERVLVEVLDYLNAAVEAALQSIQ